MMVSKPIILFGQKFFIIGTLKEEVYLVLGGKLGNPTSMGGRHYFLRTGFIAIWRALREQGRDLQSH